MATLRACRSIVRSSYRGKKSRADDHSGDAGMSRAQKNDRPVRRCFRLRAPAFAVFEKKLIDDVIPTIDSRYSTIKKADGRALAGLSMGGGQTFNFRLTHLDTFAWLGAFCAAPNTKAPAELIPDPAKAKKQLKYFLITCGNKDGLLYSRQRMHVFLKEKDIPHVGTSMATATMPLEP